MAKIVIRRDGSREPFDEGKIRRAIEASAREAGLPADRVTAVVNQVANVVLAFAAPKEEISTLDIRAKVLALLEEMEPSVSAAWRRFDKARGRE